MGHTTLNAPGVSAALNLTARAARDIVNMRWSGWLAVQPELGQVEEPERLDAWMKAADNDPRDQILFALITVAAGTGADANDAALLVAWLMRGPAAVYAHKYHFVDDIDHHVAVILWLAIKQHPRKTRRVWASLCSYVRTGLFNEFSTAARLDTIDPHDQEHLAASTQAADISPAQQLAAFLNWGVQREIITAEDERLLWDMLSASASISPEAGGASLLGDKVSNVVALSRMVSGRTIRRRAVQSIDRLQQCHTQWPRSA